MPCVIIVVLLIVYDVVLKGVVWEIVMQESAVKLQLTEDSYHEILICLNDWMVCALHLLCDCTVDIQAVIYYY